MTGDNTLGAFIFTLFCIGLAGACAVVLQWARDAHFRGKERLRRAREAQR